MATHKLGKLQFDLSKKGFGFKFGDGKEHRFGKSTDEAEYEENYESGEEYEDDRGYESDSAGDDRYADDDRYDDDDRYADDDRYDDDDRYADDDRYGDDDRYADDDRYDDDDRYSDDDRYADDRYDDDDRYADDDGYDDGDRYDDADDRYGDDDGYYDEDGQYDDRYLDEDADGNYRDGDYDRANPVLSYVFENDWVTYALLFILPPLGIYLLWRRMRFERNTRIAISAVSGVWFIVAIILLILLIGGTGDKGDPSTVITNPIEPTPTTYVYETEAPDETEDTQTEEEDTGTETVIDSLLPDATATPLPSANGSEAISSDTVYMPATGLYYHKTDSCTAIESGVKVSKVTLDVATAKALAPCPVCYEGQTYCYATANGKYYHYVEDCSGMSGAVKGTVQAAQNQGKTACPVCVTGTVNSLQAGALKFANSSTNDASGITVYATQNGKYFHVKSDCSGMSGASSGSLLAAMLAGKTACPECCASAGETVYATQGGTYYHSYSTCSGMENAYQITLAEALILGKAKCPNCLGAVSETSMSAESITDDSTVYVYGTKGGKYYHTKSNCSGMTGATKYTLKAMLQAGRAACPECCAGANTIVYAKSGGKYYHSYASCSGMKDASQGTVAQALAYGYKKCPNCWNGTTPIADATGATSEVDDSDSTSSSETGYRVYATKEGSYYHTNSSCSGMKDPYYVTMQQAVSAGKVACPTCASAAYYKVYSTDGGKYYHATSDCSGMKNAKQRTIQDAILLGQTACPTCVSKYNAWKAAGGSTETSDAAAQAEAEAAAEAQRQQILIAAEQAEQEEASSQAAREAAAEYYVQNYLPSSSGTFTAGTSGIKVYATIDGPYYHTKSGCSGMTNASYITLETALNYGKTGCPSCASSANTTVYAVQGGRYYHYSYACAGSGAVSGSRAAALAYGFSPCPYCVSQVQIISNNTYTPGTSGIKVYATLTGNYYHASESCAGSGASYVTLETALNYGKAACPNCAASANITVYAEPGGHYYHASSSCAGSNAVAGGFAQALAYGLQQCPLCIGGSESYEQSDVVYGADPETIVYIDIDSSSFYYHTNSRCSDAGLSGGTGVMLEFVLKSGYHACPYCTPPTYYFE